MEIVIQTNLDGFSSSTNTKLGTKIIKFTNAKGEILGWLLRDQLNEQLNEKGFEINNI